MATDKPHSHRAQTRPPHATVLRSVLLTLASAIIPGSGLLATKRRALAAGFIVFALAAIGFIVWAASDGWPTLRHWAVQPRSLATISVVVVVVGLVWVASLVCTAISTRPSAATPSQRAIGAGVVAVLSIAVMAPMALASQYATTQRNLVQTVFASDNTRSATIDIPKITKQIDHHNKTKSDPWKGTPRLNILLLGGDGGYDRLGVRTDTMIVASIDTHTGNTVLLSLPRNLMRVPLPPHTALAKAYGGTFYGAGPEGNWMLNAMYRLVPADHPEVMKNSDHQGADILKATIGYDLGLKIDYFALVNLEGFKKLVTALGGITVNINYPIPVGGDTDTGTAPTRYLQPGKNVHLNGGDALWYARGRYGVAGGDYARMDRQRCFIDAVINQANPERVLTKYEALASSAKDIISTDIPAKLLPQLVDLALKIKDAKITSAVFDDKVTYYANPDWAKIKTLAQKAVKASAKKTPVHHAHAAGHKGKKTSTASPSPGSAANIHDVCAYHPGKADDTN